MAKAKAPVKKVPNGLKLTLEGSPLEVKVAFAAITPKGLQYGGSLASSKEQEVSFSDFCGQLLNPEGVAEGAAPKRCCTKLSRKTLCERHPKVEKHEVKMKGYDTGGGNFVFLTEEQVEKFKARGESSIHITSLEARAPEMPDAMQRLFAGARYLVPVDLEDPDTCTRFEALRAFLGPRMGVARVLWRRSFSYGLVVPAQAGGFFVHSLSSLGRAYDLVEVPLGRFVKPEQARTIEERGAAAAQGRLWSDDLVRDNPFVQGIQEAILAIVEGRDVEEVETPEAPKREVDILAIV